MQRANRKRGGDIAHEWWKELTEGDARLEGRNRAATARIRRATSVRDVLMEPEVLQLLKSLTRQHERVAVMAGVLVHVKKHTQERVGRIIGRETFSDASSATMSEGRLRRLIHCKENDLLRTMRATVKMAQGQANVAELAQSILRWSDCEAGDEVKAQWILDYYGAWPSAEPRTRKDSDIAHEWWRELTEGDSRLEGRNRAAAARIRRATSVLDVLMEPQVLKLVSSLTRQQERVAVMAGVLVHVKKHTHERIGQIIGRRTLNDSNSAAMSEVPFRRLIHCKERDLLRVMRAAVAIAAGRANVAHLARSILQWSDCAAGDEIKSQWILDYYGAGPPAVGTTEEDTDSDAETEAGDEQVAYA